MAVTDTRNETVLMDTGMFIGALLKGDPRHAEARPVVEHARQGMVPACTTTGILSEVYGALTWEHAVPRHTPAEAADIDDWQAFEADGLRIVGPPTTMVHLVQQAHRSAVR
jgi:predicted nucleic acid-binding protein